MKPTATAPQRRFTWDVFVMGGDPNAEALTARARWRTPRRLDARSTAAQTTSGERFACPDNMFIDSTPPGLDRDRWQ